MVNGNKLSGVKPPSPATKAQPKPSVETAKALIDALSTPRKKKILR
jgi:hypothetical protein